MWGTRRLRGSITRIGWFLAADADDASRTPPLLIPPAVGNHGGRKRRFSPSAACFGA